MSLQLDHATVQHVFIATWIVLGIASAIFIFTAPPALKRKWHPIISISAGLLFLGFVFVLSEYKIPFFLPVAVAVIMYLNIKTVVFCPKCGAMNRSPYIYPIPKYCRKCGTDLHAAPASET
jgi:hypothetical protein